MCIQTPSPLKVEERCPDDGARPGVTAGTAKFPKLVQIETMEQEKKLEKLELSLRPLRRRAPRND